MAAEGVHKLPLINGGRELKEALQKLGSIPSSKILVRSILSPIFASYLQLYSVSALETRTSWSNNLFSYSMQAVEVLWTPQNENDTLSERELLEDYPLLRPL